MAAALGVFILWFGWFGFNPGSQLAASGEVNRVAISHVFLTTNLAAVCGGLGTMFTSWIKYGKPSFSLTLNGILAGLVAITAGCDLVSPLGSAIIGLLAGIILVFSIEFIDTKLHIDDPVGASSVHGVCGIFGTLMTGLFALDGGAFYGGGFGFFGAQLLRYHRVSTFGQLQQVSSSSGVSRRLLVSVLTSESRRKVSISTSMVRVATTKVPFIY